jgi:hypothetical protein
LNLIYNPLSRARKGNRFKGDKLLGTNNNDELDSYYQEDNNSIHFKSQRSYQSKVKLAVPKEEVLSKKKRKSANIFQIEKVYKNRQFSFDEESDKTIFNKGASANFESISARSNINNFYNPNLNNNINIFTINFMNGSSNPIKKMNKENGKQEWINNAGLPGKFNYQIPKKDDVMNIMATTINDCQKNLNQKFQNGNENKVTNSNHGSNSSCNNYWKQINGFDERTSILNDFQNGINIPSKNWNVQDTSFRRPHSFSNSPSNIEEENEVNDECFANKMNPFNISFFDTVPKEIMKQKDYTSNTDYNNYKQNLNNVNPQNYSSFQDQYGKQEDLDLNLNWYHDFTID